MASQKNKGNRVINLIDGPNVVGMYGINADGTYSSGLSLLHYVNEVNGPVHMDLTIHDNKISEDNEGDETKESEEESKTEALVLNEEYIERLKTKILKLVETGEMEMCLSSNFHRYLMKHPEFLCQRAVSNIQNVTFISDRWSLRILGNLPYEKKMFNYFKACLIGGIIYISHAHESEVELFKNTEDSKLDEASSATEKINDEANSAAEKIVDESKIVKVEVDPGKIWGLVFEDYMLSDQPNKKPDPYKAPNPHQSPRVYFNCVYELKFFNHDIFYWGELDGVIPPKDCEYLKSDNEEELIKALSDMEFVELKSSLKGENTNNFQFYKTKGLWIQCFFGRVHKVFIGYRTFDGVIYAVKNYSLPELVQKSKGWSPSRINGYINNYLTFVKRTFIEIVKKIPQNMNNSDIRCLPAIQVNFMTTPRSSQPEIVLIPEALDSNLLDMNYELFLATLTWKKFGKDINSAIKKALLCESNEVDLFKNTINEICRNLISCKFRKDTQNVQTDKINSQKKSMPTNAFMPNFMKS